MKKSPKDNKHLERRNFITKVGTLGAGVLVGAPLASREALGATKTQTFSRKKQRKTGAANKFLIDVDGFIVDEKGIAQINRQLVRDAVKMVRELGKPAPGNPKSDFSTFSTFSTFSEATGKFGATK